MHCGQLSPRGVGNVLGQHSASQAFDVEVFDRYPAKPIDDIAGNLVQVMPSTVSDVGMEPRHGRLALLPGVGAAFAPGDSALPAPKLFGGALRPVWPLLGLSVAQGERWHLDALLRFDIAPDRGLGHGTDRCREITPLDKV